MANTTCRLQVQVSILGVIKATKSLLLREMTSDQYTEKTKEILELLQQNMVSLVSLAGQLYKAIRIAEKRRKERQV